MAMQRVAPHASPTSYAVSTCPQPGCTSKLPGGGVGPPQGRVSSVGMMRLLALRGSETLRDSSWERSARLVAGGSPSGAPRKGVPGPLGGSDSAQDPGFLVSFQRLLLEGWRQSPMLMRQASQ